MCIRDSARPRRRRGVQDAVDEEHCFSRARVGVALGLASTASRARARAGSERGLEPSLRSSALRRAAVSQGLRGAKLCRTSDEPCTLVWLSAPTSSCSLGAWLPSVLLDASWQDAAQHCFGAPSRPNRWLYTCAHVSLRIRTQPAAPHAVRAEDSSPPPHCLQPQQRSRAADRTAAAAPHCAAAAPPPRKEDGLRRRRHQGQVPHV